MREAVRSGRRANFFITENRFIDHYAAKVGGSGVAVYSILQRCANSETRETWISANKMAEVLAMDKSTVYRHLKQLEELRLIKSLRTREKTIYVVLPVPPPRTEACGTPLFDAVENEKSSKHEVWPQEAVQNSRTDESNSYDYNSSVASLPFSVAPTRRTGLTSANGNKEEQEFFNKTQEQEFLNKTEIGTIKSAKTLLKGLHLPETYMSAAIAAIEQQRKNVNYSSDWADSETPFAGAVMDLRSRANEMSRNGVSNDKFLEDFLATRFAERLLQNLGLPDTKSMVSTVSSAIKAEANYSKLPIEKSAEHINTAAINDRGRGATIDRFYFENVKWRSNARVSKAEQRKLDNLAANARAKEILRGQLH